MRIIGDHTPMVEMAIWDEHTTDVDESTDCIPGPCVSNLLVLYNPVWILFGMTMGYFVTFRIEEIFCDMAQDHLRNNKKYLKERQYG